MKRVQSIYSVAWKDVEWCNSRRALVHRNISRGGQIQGLHPPQLSWRVHRSLRFFAPRSDPCKGRADESTVSSVLHSLLFFIFGEAIGEYRAAVAPMRSDEAQ